MASHSIPIENYSAVGAENQSPLPVTNICFLFCSFEKFKFSREGTPMDQHGRGPRGYPQGGNRDNRPRPQVISKPTPCDLTVNLYKYTGKKLEMHRYAVTFTPEIRRCTVFNRFMRIAEENGLEKPFAFDGAATLVSLKKFSDKEFRVPMRDEELICRVEYKTTCRMGEEGDQTLVMNSLEVLYKFYQRSNFSVTTRSVFSPHSSRESLGPGVEVIPGLSACIKATKLGLHLNLDMAFCAFYKSKNLVDFMREVAERVEDLRPGGPAEYDSGFYNSFEKMLRLLRLTTNHRERPSTFKAAGLLMRPAHEVEFETEAGKQTVAEYFAKAYKPLRYPHLPLVVVKRRDSEVYIPMEVLDVTPMQKLMKKVDEAMCSRMIKIAATRPAERFKHIAQKAEELGALQNDTIKEFGICFDNRMVNCKGTILPPPELKFSKSTKQQINGGWNLAGVSAVEGVDIPTWKVILMGNSRGPTADQLRRFTTQAEGYGVRFGRPTTDNCRDEDEFFKARKAPFNLVILPDSNSRRYENIKRISETYGQSCYTQCMLAKNVRSLTDPAFIGNLLLKINTKLGGRNWMLATPLLADKETILLGIDVAHPGAGDQKSPSIVGIVGSMDYSFVTYSSMVRQQGHRQEVVETLQGAIRDMLKRHYKSTGRKPQRIVLFRDGVGDSVFDAVFNSEIESVRAACTELSSSYKPELNFIVSQKRHSIRFSAGGRNPHPGTVVEDVAQSTAGGVYDFYLVAHTAFQGTSRPVRYLVMLNESNFSQSDVCKMVYSLCHLYMRASKSVSLVSPVYYADLAASRGMCYLEESDSGALVMRNLDPVFEKTLYYL